SAPLPSTVEKRVHALSLNFSRKDLATLALLSSITSPFASFNARTSSALACPCSLTCAPVTPLRGRQSNESRLSIPRSDVPEAAIVGATSLAIHCATASAIGQRRVAGGESATRCPSGRSTASSLTTSLAMHCPGPVMDGDGSKA